MNDVQLDPVLVGNVISSFRQKRDLSQEVVSGFAGIGRTHLSAIERGERKPILKTLFHIACALDVPASTILKEIESHLKT